MPPRHLADLDPGRPPGRGRRARRAGVPRRAARPRTTSAGWCATRRAMTDLPAAARERLAGALLPTLLTPVRELACDGGATRKTLWRLHDGALVESVLMGYPRPGHRLRLQPGRLRHGLPVLRHRPGRADPQPVRPPRSSTRSVAWPRGGRRRRGRRAAPARLSHVVFMGMGEPLANYPRVIAARPPADRRRRPTGSACPSGTSPSPRSAWCRRCAGSPTRGCGDPCGVAARAR